MSNATDFEASMKPLLMVAVQEAVKLAFIDSVTVPTPDGNGNLCDGRERFPTADERRSWAWNLDAMPDEVRATASLDVVARNTGLRLFGGGGFTVNGVYAGNATPQQILEACVERPDQDPLGDISMALTDLGFTITDDEPTEDPE